MLSSAPDSGIASRPPSSFAGRSANGRIRLAESLHGLRKPVEVAPAMSGPDRAGSTRKKRRSEFRREKLAASPGH